MAARVMLPLALAACASAAAVHPREPSPGFVSFPVHHQRSKAPVIAKRADTDVPLYNISTVSYLIQLSIGTPGQTVKVAIDTGSDELWVNPDCTSSSLDNEQEQECQQDGKYTPSSSSTSTKVGGQADIPYGKGEVLISYYNDSISLPDSDIKMTNVQFGVASQSVDLNEGILGLGFGDGKNLNYSNFVDQLALQKVTNSRAFTVALGSQDADNGGVIIFGGVDTKKFSGKLAALPILPPQGGESISRYWVNMDSIGATQSGSSKSYTSTQTPVVLDSGSSLSYLPSAVVKSMATDLGGKFDSQSGLYLVPCSKSTTSNSFDFTFSGNKISVPWSEFIWDVDGTNCVLGAEPADPSSGITALLGDTFMRSAYTVFDQTSNNVYIAPYANCGQNEQTIPSGSVSFSGECNAGDGATGSQSGSKNAGARTGGIVNVWLAVAGLAAVQALMMSAF